MVRGLGFLTTPDRFGSGPEGTGRRSRSVWEVGIFAGLIFFVFWGMDGHHESKRFCERGTAFFQMSLEPLKGSPFTV